MKMLLLLLAAFTTGATNDENYKEVYVDSHIAWSAYAVQDTFDGAEVAWFAVHSVGDNGSIRFHCGKDDNAPDLLAFVDNPFIKTLGVAWKSRDPIAARFKVGGNDVLETEGRYPNLLASGDELRPVFQEMVAGDNAGGEISEVVRIRTTHGEEQHTFSTSLAGFTAASQWVLVKCGLQED